MASKLRSKASRGSKKKMDTLVVSKHVEILTPKYSHVVKCGGSVCCRNFEALITPPPGFTVSDWIVVNAVCFLQRIELLFMSCSLFCTINTCPMFNAGPHYEYYWEDEDTAKPVQLSAPEYFTMLKRWIRRQLTNKKLFPPTGDLGPDAIAILKTVYRRLARILAHLYMCHFSQIRKQNLETVMNTVLVHYSRFAEAFDLVQLSELEMLKPVFAAVEKAQQQPPVNA
jgi:MOB kinase activator 1